MKFEREARFSVVALALCAFALLLIAAIWIYTIDRARTDAVDASQSEFRKNENLALALEVRTTRLLLGADNVLRILKNYYEHEDPSFPVDRLIPPEAARQAGFVIVFRADEKGRVANSWPASRPISIGDRQAFVAHRQHDSGRMLITGPVLGRITGRWGVQLSRRLNHPDGTFDGIVLIGVEPRYFTDLFEGAAFGPGDVMSLIRIDGVTLARRVGQKTSFGEDVGHSALMTQQRRASIGSYSGRGALDGVEKFFSYRTLPNYPLIATVGTNATTVLAPVRDRGRRYYIMASAATAFIAAFCAGLLFLIHRRRTAELERSRIGERLIQTLDHLDEGFFAADASWRSTFVNREYERLIQTPRDRLLGFTILEQFGSEAGAEFEAAFRRTMEEKVPVIFEAFHRRRGIWLEVRAYPDDDGLSVYVRDVSGRHIAEEEIRHQEERYRAIFDGVTNGIVILDRTGRIVTANRAAETMHGWPVDQLAGRPGVDLIDPEETEIRNVVATESKWNDARSWETLAVRRDGALLDVILSTAPVEIRGEPHLLLVITNVSKEKNLQHQLEHSARVASLGHIAASIAHEMNNVMMGILPFAEIVARMADEDSPLREASAQITRGIERGRAATRGILRFTRAVNEPELLPIDAAAFLASLAQEVRRSAGDAIELQVSCEQGLLLSGDAGQLQQMLMNLVANAQDAMAAGGTVTLGLETLSPGRAPELGIQSGDATKWAHFFVSDTGSGIEPEALERIFEPLFTTKGTAGTGLGLSIVRQIVSAHGGRVHVESRLGTGTTFHILLRKATPAATIPGVLRTVDPWATIHTVLLVEDDLSVGEGIAALLEMGGIECQWVGGGLDALASLRSSRPDLLILDVGLPDMSGTEVYQQAVLTHPGLLTIFSTGHGDQRLVEALSAPPHVAVLSKPWDFQMLTACAAGLLARTAA